MKTKIKKNKFIIVSYVMLLTLLPAAVLFSQLIGNRMNQHIYQTMEDTANLCAEMIERQYDSDMLMLEGLSVRMSTTLKENPDMGVERMISTAERYGMKRIAFTTPDGATIATDNAEMDLTGIDNFERALKGEALLTTVINDVVDGQPVNIYSLPVYADDTGEILGVLSAVHYSDFFKELLSASSFDGEGYTYIVDSTGTVVIGSTHENSVKGLDNLFSYMQEHGQKQKKLDEIKSNFATKSPGFFEMKSSNGKRFACYIPVDINDWYVVSAVPMDVAEHTKEAVMLSVLVYCIAISVVAVFVVLSVSRAMKEKNGLLEAALYVDPLTGGKSYEKFRLDCKKQLQRHPEKKAAFVFLDIDNFNLVSTLYGHEESVDTIRRVYAMIQNCVGEHGIIGRNSSDQFCVMYFYEEQEEFERSMQYFVQLLHDNAKFENMLRPTMGIYLVTDPTEGIYDMMNKARTAHESIKHNEGKVVAYYDEGFRDKRYQNKHMEDEMEQALLNHEFVPYLQPKYNASTGTICGAEALIRWITEEGKIIPPGMFIPLAENNGFVRKLDREMFSMVCQMQKNLLEQGLKPVPVSVNVSRQLLYDKTFADDYCNYVQELGIPADLVELEITESAFFEDINLFRSTLEKLRSFGFRILMDDFGTGYSSLMMLHTVPIDIMKLDKSFIDDYADEKGSSIIQCVLNLAKMLKIPVVAEGVETQDQYFYLKDSGCDVIQGYYFSKPVPKAEFLQKLSA